TTDWRAWGPNWKAVGEVHEGLGRDAEQGGRTVSATQAYQRASWCYHLGKFLWFEDARVHAELRDRSVSIYRRALPHLDPPAVRPNWETVITPVLEHLAQIDLGVDLDRVGLMGISMGAIYGPRAAASEQRLRAIVGLAGPYNLGDCWDALNPLTRGGYIFYTKSASEAEARQQAGTLNLEGVLDRVTQPLLVIHGSPDRPFPPAHAARLTREPA